MLGDDGIAKRVYVGECEGSRLVGRPWIDTEREREMLGKIGKWFIINRSESLGFVMGNTWGVARRVNP